MKLRLTYIHEKLKLSFPSQFLEIFRKIARFILISTNFPIVS